LNTGTTPQTPKAGNDLVKTNRLYLLLTAGCAVAAVVAVGVYAAQSNAEVFWRSVGLAAATALAAFWLVGIIGFLFGIPNSAPEDITTNQSLEQIADWLTKIIIGATLVQLGTIGSFVADVGDNIGKASGLPGGPQLYTALIVATGACGFVYFFFWAYMCWESMRMRERLKKFAALQKLRNAGAISAEDYASKYKSELDKL
jgi:hypothetical protein